MGLADEARLAAAARRPYQVCQLYAAREQLDEADAVELMELIADRTVSANTISDVLAARDIFVSDNAIYRARNNRCTCCRRWVEQHG